MTVSHWKKECAQHRTVHEVTIIGDPLPAPWLALRRIENTYGCPISHPTFARASGTGGDGRVVDLINTIDDTRLWAYRE